MILRESLTKDVLLLRPLAGCVKGRGGPLDLPGLCGPLPLSCTGATRLAAARRYDAAANTALLERLLWMVTL